MASPPLLDFDALLAPIPGDNPAGEPVPYEIRQQLEEDRKEVNPEDLPDEDRTRAELLKRADWPAIIQKTQEVLQQTSKDLLTAARLTEALTRQNGFAGIRDGLRLMRRLVDECWDRLNPAIEDGDVEVRVTPFVWLDDPVRGARFPSTLLTQPLIEGAERNYNWQEWRRAKDRQGTIGIDEIEQAIQATDADKSHTLAEDIGESLQELNQLTYKLNEKMGGQAPGLGGLRQSLENCAMLARDIDKRKGGQDAGGDEPGTTTNGATTTGGRLVRAPATRDEVYRQLAQAAALLKQLEPHSPIPYFIERAVALGALPFPLMIKELIHEQAVLTELNRVLGIKEPAAPA